MNQLEEDYYKFGAFMTPEQQNRSAYTVHLEQAVRRIKRLETERTLLKGHFSKIAKEYHVKVTDLKKAYNN